MKQNDWGWTHDEICISSDEALADYKAANGDDETEAEALDRLHRKAIAWFETGREMRLLPFETGKIGDFSRITNAVLAANSADDIHAVFCNV